MNNSRGKALSGYWIFGWMLIVAIQNTTRNLRQNKWKSAKVCTKALYDNSHSSLSVAFHSSSSVLLSATLAVLVRTIEFLLYFSQINEKKIIVENKQTLFFSPLSFHFIFPLLCILLSWSVFSLKKANASINSERGFFFNVSLRKIEINF
jgi:hypothetical protein